MLNLQERSGARSVFFFSFLFFSRSELERQAASANQRPWIADNTGVPWRMNWVKVSLRQARPCRSTLRLQTTWTKCAWGLSKRDLRYPERLTSGVNVPKRCSNKGQCFRWNQVCGRPQEQPDVNRFGYSCHRYVGMKASALTVCPFFLFFFLLFNACICWFLAVRWLCEDAWYINKVAVPSWLQYLWDLLIGQ